MKLSLIAAESTCAASCIPIPSNRLVAVQARSHGRISQREQEISAALSRGVSVPVQQPEGTRHIRQGDSRVLRHEHWRMSQLSKNDASEPEQLELVFPSTKASPLQELVVRSAD